MTINYAQETYQNAKNDRDGHRNAYTPQVQ